MLKTYYPQRNSRIIILAGLLLFVAVLVLLWGPRGLLTQKDEATVQQARGKDEPWMTVFINGSFGSLLGFLNFSDVLQDNVSGTLYRKTIKKMRDDPFFFRDQPILQRGLIPVTPTFNLEDVGGKKYAVYPIAKAYEEILNTITPGKEKNYFYTFGWSGLVSQKSRRYEAIRLYNALSEELEKFNRQGIKPKIRLIAHSHGGNLCLYLAAIRSALAFVPYDDEKSFSENPDENESLKKMVEILKNHTSKEHAKTMIDQKVYDYVPTTPNLSVDELIMMGTPIQPETERFCYSDFFNKVYNLYSYGDIVQRIDWVTSKQAHSSQRVAKDSSMRVVQARLMAEKSVQDGIVQAVGLDQQKSDESAQEPTVLDEFLSGRNFFVREGKDPTHKELWFISWKDEAPIFRSFLSPLPVVVLVPLLLHALNTISHTKDVDINLDVVADQVNVYVADYQQQVIKGSVHIPLACIQEIQEKIKAWTPDDLSQTADFNAAYKHIE